MAYGLPRSEVVNAVWLAARDGRWCSLRALAQKTRIKEEEITAALRFLVRYGFAETLGESAVRFRMVRHGPSPFEAANLLRAIEIRPA
jgi:DNA-binding IclR family transcriptional regulator